MAKTPCPKCEKLFKGEGGLKWHLEHLHGQNAVDGAQGTPQDEGDAALPESESQNTTPESTDQRQGAEDIESTLEERQRQVDSLFSGEEVPEPLLVMLDGLTRRVEGLEARVAYLPQVRQLVEGLVKDRGSMRQYDADRDLKLRAVFRILRELENPERTGFASLADDGACGIPLSEARDLLKLAPLRLVASKSAGDQVGV